MCSSGGGGDGGAAEREDNRQREQDAAIGRVNSLFGISSDENQTAMPDRNDERFYSVSRPEGSPTWIPAERTFNQELYDQAVADAQNSTTGNAEAIINKAALDEMYKGVGTDVSSYLTHNLDEQHTDAQRNGRFNVARRGVRGGSSELDMQGNLKETYDKSIIDINNRALDAENNLRSADSSTRLNMIQRVLSGMSGDAAITSAQQSMKDNLASAKSSSLAQSLDNVFGGFSYINDAEAQRRGVTRANDYYGTYYPTTKSYSGSTS